MPETSIKFAKTAVSVAAGLMTLLVASGGFAHDESTMVVAAESATGTNMHSSHETASDGTVDAPHGPSLMMPIMNSARGRKAFAAKGCVTCHAVNGVGGHDAPNLDAHSMQPFMNPFDFAAKMWRGASAMILLQEEAFGYQIELTGQELGDIIAFVHDDEEQHKFSPADIPPDIMALMHHTHGAPGGTEEHRQELGHHHGGDHHQN